MQHLIGNLIVFVCLMACADTIDRLIKDHRYFLAFIVMICTIFMGVAWVFALAEHFE